MKKLFPFLATFALVALTSFTLFSQNHCSIKAKTLYETSSSTRIYWSLGLNRTFNLQYRTVGSTAWQTMQNVKSGFELTGLAQNTEYEYNVFYDCSSISTIIIYPRFKTLSDCKAASNLSETDIKVNSATIQWTRNGALKEYIAYKEASANEYIVLNHEALKSPFLLKNLKPNTVYEYYITSFCPAPPQPNSGTWVKSEVRRFKTKEAASCADVQFLVKPEGNSSLTAYWFHNNQNVQDYKLCYKKTSESDFKCQTISKTQNSVSILAQPNTNYEFEFHTTCSDGAVFIQKQSISTAPLPPCSIGTTYNNITESSVEIGISGNISNFNAIIVNYKKASDAEYTTRVYPVSNTLLLDGLMPATDYDIYVVSSCQGNVDLSNTFSIKTAAPALPCPTITDFILEDLDWSGCGHEFKLSWTIPPTGLSYTIDMLHEGYSIAKEVWEVDNAISQTGLPPSFLSKNFCFTFDIVHGRRTTFTVNCSDGTKTTTVYDWPFDLLPPPPPLIRDRKNITQDEQKTKIASENTEGGYSLTASDKKATIKTKLLVTPNPTSHDISVILPHDSFNQILIKSIDGRIVKNISLKNQNRVQKIDCSDLKSGLYIITAHGYHEDLIEKFIKL